MMIRQAIAFAGVHKYAYDEDSTKRPSGDDPAARRDRFIRQESQRRTFWSCFILDRILSVGKGRPRVIQVKDLTALQIPCSDKNFISGRAVRTRLFGETDEAYAKRRKEIREQALQRDDGHEPPRIEWEDRRDDGMLGRWIFALDHFADVNEWSNNGGRRSEKPNIGPWNPDTKYYQLEKRLRDIKEELPDELQLTSINTENHVYETPSTTSRTYYLIHAILQLSTAYLYPEYLPTYGFRLKKPQGPMDAPLVTDPVPEDQPHYWEDKAKECFEYVRDFVSMLRSFKDRDLVVESPFIAHAVYKAAWCAMYCFHVPKMDPSRALDAKLEPNAWDITNQVLGNMRKKFKVVNGMSKDLATTASVYTDRLREWRNSGGTPTSNFSDSDGGLNEYAEKFERAHKQFGSFEHDQEDLAYPTDKPYSRLKHEEDLSDPASAQSPIASFKAEPEDARRSTSSHSGFTSVNAGSAAISVQTPQPNNTMRPSQSAQPMYSPQAPQQPQASQPYSAQTLSYEQSPGYGYSSTTPTFPQTATHYGVQTAYARTSGPAAGQNNVSYNPQRMMELEKEGNVSLRTGDVFFYQNEELFPNPDQWPPGGNFAVDQLSASQYMYGQQAPYSSYPGWSGQ
ncbi:hypothetical protein N0V91_003815 [Didymella pomorum]|uniref:Xylanolytic transcriptional activator regulatory domain-containing protein n=1 Tax=Didymella pomorum TaxID=749634 RepID=A0A9W8ZHQ9_9PLEO|nr:hypothetical protein N0V91_003815 [Didymella pomorum]